MAARSLPVAGEPTYVEAGYVDDGYQFIDGQVVPLDAGDIAYTVPVDAPNDDGVHFPLSYRQAILVNTTHGSADAQAAAISALAEPPVTGFSGPTGTQEQIDAIVNRSTEVPRQIEELLKANSVWQEIKFRNLDTGPFETRLRDRAHPARVAAGHQSGGGLPLREYTRTGSSARSREAASPIRPASLIRRGRRPRTRS